MICDAQRLREVIEEIAEWSLAERRSFLTATQTAFGEESEMQLKTGLIEYWRTK